MSSSKEKNTYQQAGVHIDAGNEFVDRIKPLVHQTRRPGADTNLGGFGGLFDLAAVQYDDPVLVSATDGVGTKLKLAFGMDKHDTIGIDLVAMCVNDLVVQGANPLFFLDYFSTGGLDVDKATSVVEGISKGCQQAGCALIGGETAEMPGMYEEGHYDLAGFAVGAVERERLLPKTDIDKGDVLIGIASSGFHSNGYSLIRYVLEKNKIELHDPSPVDTNYTVGEELLTPTKIYASSCLELYRQVAVKAFAHITGGGLLENIPRVIPKGLAVKIKGSSWRRPAIFDWFERLGKIDEHEMYRTFNCGIGMVVIVAKEDADMALEILQGLEEKAFVIGRVVGGRGKDDVTIT